MHEKENNKAGASYRIPYALHVLLICKFGVRQLAAALGVRIPLEWPFLTQRRHKSLF